MVFANKTKDKTHGRVELTNKNRDPQIHRDKTHHNKDTHTKAKELYGERLEKALKLEVLNCLLPLHIFPGNIRCGAEPCDTFDGRVIEHHRGWQIHLELLPLLHSKAGRMTPRSVFFSQINDVLSIFNIIQPWGPND